MVMKVNSEMSHRIMDDIIKINPRIYGARNTEYPWAIVNANLLDGMTVLDIGCNSTPFSIYLSNIGCNVFSVDIEHINYYKDTGVKYTVAGFENLPYKDNLFDRIFSISVFEHILELKKFKSGCLEVGRVLKNDGLLVVTMDIAFNGKSGLDKSFTNPNADLYFKEMRNVSNLYYILREKVYDGLIVENTKVAFFPSEGWIFKKVVK